MSISVQFNQKKKNSNIAKKHVHHHDIVKIKIDTNYHYFDPLVYSCHNLPKKPGWGDISAKLFLLWASDILPLFWVCRDPNDFPEGLLLVDFVDESDARRFLSSSQPAQGGGGAVPRIPPFIQTFWCSCREPTSPFQWRLGGEELVLSVMIECIVLPVLFDEFDIPLNYW